MLDEQYVTHLFLIEAFDWTTFKQTEILKNSKGILDL